MLQHTLSCSQRVAALTARGLTCALAEDRMRAAAQVHPSTTSTRTVQQDHRFRWPRLTRIDLLRRRVWCLSPAAVSDGQSGCLCRPPAAWWRVLRPSRIPRLWRSALPQEKTALPADDTCRRGGSTTSCGSQCRNSSKPVPSGRLAASATGLQAQVPLHPTVLSTPRHASAKRVHCRCEQCRPGRACSKGVNHVWL